VSYLNVRPRSPTWVNMASQKVATETYPSHLRTSVKSPACFIQTSECCPVPSTDTMNSSPQKALGLVRAHIDIALRNRWYYVRYNLVDLVKISVIPCW